MSFKIEHPVNRLVLCLAGCALILWGFYLATLSPAFPPDDSPETIAAAFSLGIQHPPGYPLAALLGRCAIVALPLGAPAFRVNLLSAALACFAAVLAGAMAWRLVPKFTQGRVSSAVLAAFSLGFLAVTWDLATEAKGGIYLLNLVLGFGLWHVVIDLNHFSWRRPALLAGGLSGLMLANHFASAALWIVPTAIYFFWRAKQARTASFFGLAALALLPGLSLYAYLPLRAEFLPLLNWGDPSTWKQFWWMLSRGGYTQAQLAAYEGLSEAQVSYWWKSLGQLGIGWCLSLSVVGAWALWQRRKGLAATLGSAILLTLYAALIVNKTPPENQWLVLIFALPATALLTPLAGVGLATLQGEESAGLGYLGLGVAWGLGLWLAFGTIQRADRSGSYVAWDYAHDLSLSMPRASLYMAEGDYHVLPFLHFQAVQGKRPDVLSVLNVLSGDAWYQKLLQARDPQLLLPAVGPAANATLEMAALNARTRTLRISPFSALMSPQTLGVAIHQVGLLRGLGQSEAAPAQSLAWSARPPARQGADLEKIEADLLPWYTVALVQEGNEAMGRHHPQAAISAYRRALGRPGPKPDGPLAYNLGLAYEDSGRQDLAILAYQHGIEADPNFKPAAERLQRLVAKP